MVLNLHLENAKRRMQDIVPSLNYLQEEKSKLWFIHHTGLILLLRTFAYSVV
jgi:hypothetical protein